MDWDYEGGGGGGGGKGVGMIWDWMDGVCVRRFGKDVGGDRGREPCHLIVKDVIVFFRPWLLVSKLTNYDYTPTVS